MPAPYYVDPEYWLEGYAEGDAKIVSAAVSVFSTTSANANRVTSASAHLASIVSFVAFARKKWEDDAAQNAGTSGWTLQPPSSGGWTPQSADSSVWTEQG